MNITERVAQIKQGQTSATAQVQAALQRARDAKEYHALLSLTEERALQRAREIDETLARGEDVGVLAGVPFVVKDNYLAYGAPSTAASKMLENFDTPLQATVVDKLEAAGAICIGKSNLDAFAHGGSTENSYFGATRNAVDKTKVAGGSSGGSAVVTALDIVPFALGTDTGGSIRQPASFNGVYGIKPTYGTASRYGVVAMASSTDTMGCFARSAEDVAVVMSVMAGQDPKDMTTLPDFFAPTAEMPQQLKIGIINEAMGEVLIQRCVRGSASMPIPCDHMVMPSRQSVCRCFSMPLLFITLLCQLRSQATWRATMVYVMAIDLLMLKTLVKCLVFPVMKVLCPKINVVL